MSARIGRRAAALVVAGILAMGTIAVANAGSAVEDAVTSRKDLRHKIVDLHQLRRERRVEIHQAIKDLEGRLDTATLRVAMATNRARAHHTRNHRLNRIGKLERRERALVRSIRSRIKTLRERRVTITEWIDAQVLQACPVDGPHEVIDGWHDVREMPGTPYHLHQGNDIMAATGTPIVAPFPGEAVMEPERPGRRSGQGLRRADGYVYNAHLSAYGKLGPVQAGDVIGYVGSTGNATAPHNHFEWHPGDGEAVDPYELLMTVC